MGAAVRLVAGQGRGEGLGAPPSCPAQGPPLSSEMAPGLWQRAAGGQLRGVGPWPPEGHSACHSPSKLRADFPDASLVSWAGPPGASGQPPWPGAQHSEVSLGRQWWGRGVPACHPVSGVWGAGGGQWFLRFCGETDSLRALDLRVCQAVCVLRPFLCPAPGEPEGSLRGAAASLAAAPLQALPSPRAVTMEA